MKIKPIFSSEASFVLITGDATIPVKNSFGSVSLHWRRDGLQILNSNRFPLLVEYNGNKMTLDKELRIAWPSEGVESEMRITTTESDCAIVVVRISWTERIEQWSSYRNRITNKGELYLAELPDKFDEMLSLSNGVLCEESVETMEGLLQELKDAYKSAIVPKNQYEEISSRWKSEMCLYYVRLMSRDDISEELCTRCADFIVTYNKV